MGGYACYKSYTWVMLLIFIGFLVLHQMRNGLVACVTEAIGVTSE